MKQPDCLLLAVLLLLTFPLLTQVRDYPPTERLLETEVFHGIQIADPYRWLEDIGSEATQKWMKQQDQHLNSFITDADHLKQIKQRIAALDQTGINYGVPQKGGDYYFYNTWPKEIPHAHLHQQKGLDGKASLLVDFNQLLTDANLTYNGFSVSPSGRYLAFLINRDQSTWGQLWLYDVEGKKLLKRKISGINSPNIAWLANESGFYYIRYGSPAELAQNQLNTSIHFHTLGEKDQADQLIFRQENNPTAMYAVAMDQERKQVIVQVYQGRSDQNDVYIIAQPSPTAIRPLAQNSQVAMNYVGSQGDTYYFYSNQAAPNGKVIAIDSRNPAQQQTIIEEDSYVLAGGSSAGGNGMNFIGNTFVLLYREGTQQEIRLHDSKGKHLKSIPLETGWIGSGLQGVSDGEEAWFSLNTFLDPSTVFRLEVNSGQVQEFFPRQLPLQKTDYVTENTYYLSDDGAKVPIYIVHKKGLKKDGSNPVYMYAYGFAGWVAVPWYQPHMLTWLDMGGIYVLPGIRGGGEFGEAWKAAGIRTNRQQAINDYLAAAEYLIDEGYSQAGKVVANGWSASGSLAAAAVLQRPELFGAAMIGIPSLDLLRYTQYTPFKGWTRGFGSPDVKEEFLSLYKWSPYHNIKAHSNYPPMMITAGEKDQTTPPQHAYKFVAAMQHHQQLAEAPTLLKIVWGGGHGFGVTNEQRQMTYAQELYFLSKVLALNPQLDQP